MYYDEIKMTIISTILLYIKMRQLLRVTILLIVSTILVTILLYSFDRSDKFFQCKKTCDCYTARLTDIPCSEFNSTELMSECDDPFNCINIMSCNNGRYCCLYNEDGSCKDLILNQRCDIECTSLRR